MPPPNRPGRITNQLQFIKNTVIKAVIKHKMAWPFSKPVNTIELGLPDYFKIIKVPMDLGTVKRRLDNNYYWCAQECIDDIDQVFKNCYLYNKPNEDVTLMGNQVEKFFLSKLKSLPPVEVVLTLDTIKKGGKKEAQVRGKKVLPPGALSPDQEIDGSMNKGKTCSNHQS